MFVPRIPPPLFSNIYGLSPLRPILLTASTAVGTPYQPRANALPSVPESPQIFSPAIAALAATPNAAQNLPVHTPVRSSSLSSAVVDLNALNHPELRQCVDEMRCSIDQKLFNAPSRRLEVSQNWIP